MTVAPACSYGRGCRGFSGESRVGLESRGTYAAKMEMEARQ